MDLLDRQRKSRQDIEMVVKDAKVQNAKVQNAKVQDAKVQDAKVQDVVNKILYIVIIITTIYNG